MTKNTASQPRAAGQDAAQPDPDHQARQPAVACYVRSSGDTAYRPISLDVLRVEGSEIAEIVTFPGELFPAFELPALLT